MGKPECLSPHIHEHGLSMVDGRLLVVKASVDAPLVLCGKADFAVSRRSAELFELHEVPFKEVVRKLESTQVYAELGFAWCFLETLGTRMDGYFRYNECAGTFREMFERLEGKDGKDPLDLFNGLPFVERARFIGGNRRLTLGVYNERCGGARISVVDSGEGEEAPVILAKAIRGADAGDASRADLISLNRKQ